MKKILIFTFIGLFGLLAAANVLMGQQTKQLSDITLTVYQAQAGDDEGGGEGGGDQWKYPLQWVEQYCGAWPDRCNDKCTHTAVGRESCEGYTDGYTTPCT